MLWTAADEPAHIHPNRTEAAACSLWVVAHSASPTVSAYHATPAFAEVGRLRVEDTVTVALLDFSDAGIGGPPVL